MPEVLIASMIISTLIAYQIDRLSTCIYVE